MEHLKSGSLWSICKDDENYYIRQLSGSMHSETEAIYKLTNQEVNSYLSEGVGSLSKTINHFSDLGNYCNRSEERKVSGEIGLAIRRCIFG
ncbi:hypothetical protein G3495_20275 [Shewanella baltica]|uniref:hypothetical protein n=1 Tax=Shewanella baltica TaxID=62322 RepID=UPI00217F09B7|nr:hypothetical protein [Shewanella baltica]MCS6124043.1 hypothetical protein [Shewanella baltica]MCS6180832.1 hypothetical protein [Shewanella baltica]MCS6237426.1 hypothetical protein [Shewanella baltica]MCS6257044.1 hypothetical protein [Shewanella baltica]MCS6261290.1 hypothetical protein [Shewanella baltica]